MIHIHITGPWQVMLRQADGSYACVAESATRFTLGEVSITCLLAIGISPIINSLPHIKSFPLTF